MSQSVYRSIRFTLYLIVLALFIQLLLYAPVNAQSDDLPQAPPVQPDAPTNMAFQPHPDATNLRDFAPPGTAVAALHANPAEKSAAPFNPARDNLFTLSQEQIGVFIEEKTFDEAVTLEYTELPVLQPVEPVSDIDNATPLPPITSTDTITNGAGSSSLLKFQLDVVSVKSGQPVEAFAKPVRLVVDLRTFGLDLDQVGGAFYLAYEAENAPGELIEVPTTPHGKTGLISAEVTHFSNWSAGWRPEAWALEWRPPSVNEFTGAAAYGYAFNVPPGRNGLQPQLSLSYSSASLRGAIRQVSLGSVATGWSLNEISITRTGIENGASWWKFPDQYRLTVQGVGGRLISAGSENGAAVYYIEDQPQMRVYNYGGRSWAANQSGNSYWVVQDGSGTTYRLGYTGDSVSYQGVDSLDAGSDYDYVDIIAWHVDTITDAFGNQVNYNYIRPVRSENWGFWCPWGGNCSWTVQTFNSQVSSISYNFPGRITSLPPVSTVARLGDTQSPGTRITFGYDGQNFLSQVNVYHGGLAYPSRRHVITGSTVSVPNPSVCDEYRAEYSGHRTFYARTRILEWIEEQAWDPQSNSFVAALPKTTFEYQNYPHYGYGGKGCFSYKYLTAANNGYGGRTELSYISDGRQLGNFVNCYGWKQGDPPCSQKWPEMGQNYSVSRVLEYDGRNSPLKTDYFYSGICYDQTRTDQPACKQPDTTVEFGTIGGYNRVERVRYDFNQTTPLMRQVTYFHHDQDGTGLGVQRYGRPYRTELRNGSNVLLQKSDTTYAVTSFGPGNNIRFTYANEVISTQYEAGNSTSTRVVNFYETTFQGNQQWGKLTRQDYFNNGLFDRHEIIRYRADSSKWIIVPWATGTYDSSWLPKQVTLNFYDGNSNNPETQPLTKGQLTLSRSLLVDSPIVSGGNTFYKTSDTKFQYDLFGNQIAVITYADYGQAGHNGANWIYATLPVQSRTTSTVYDATFNLYPVQVSNPLSQLTKFDIYGFKNVAGTLVPLDGFQKQPGLLKQVTDPNLVVTKYEYDPFGRLHAVYDGYSFSGFADTNPWNGDPVALYRYWDNAWNHGSAIYLNPASNAPFVASIQKRITTYPAPANSTGSFAYNDQTYYDGFGRPIQTRSIWAAVEGQNLRREIITSTAYNALGQVSCQTVPYDVAFVADRGVVWPGSAFVNTPCTGVAHTGTTYNALAQPVMTVSPNKVNTSVVYGLNSTYVQDAANHIKSSFADVYGRLIAVDETTGVFEDQFTTTSSLGSWSTWGPGTKSIHQSSLLLTNTGGSHFQAYRNISIPAGKDAAVSFSFNSNQENLWFGFESGSWNTSTYRYWGFTVDGGNIKFLDWEGVSTHQQKVMMPFKPNTWYRALVRTSQADDRYFSVVVWEKDNPAVSSELRVKKTGAAGWHINNWHFMAKSAANGTNLRLDDYAELEVNRTRYAYDLLNNLTQVTDALGNATGMSYDAFGRKTTMTDPDMGTWKYEYNAAGNLLRQEANVGKPGAHVLCFTYDTLNRPLSRTEDSTPNNPCPATPPTSGIYHLASYTYDPTNGKGKPATISWGPAPAQNKDTFYYDTLGRMYKQTRLVDNRSYTMQTTSFDAFHRPLTVQYPNGEVVAMSYDREGENSLVAGTDTLVNNVRYNAQGQITYLDRGAAGSPVPDTTYSYYPYSLRLRQGQTGSLLNFSYGYDAVGNIRSIFDAIRNETSQYTYDHLNRLTTFATGATNTLPQVTIRARGSNADGWPVMQLRINGEVVQEWTVNSSSYANYTTQVPLTGNDNIDIVFTNDYCVPSGCANGDRNLYVDYFVVDGQTIQAESSVVSYDRGSGAAAFDGADVIAGQETMGWGGALRTTVSKNYNWATAESYGYNAIGNMTSKNGATYSYNDAAHKHAVTHLGGVQKFWYDANGNMTKRIDGSVTYDPQVYDVENRLISVTRVGTGATTFAYDAAGNRVKSVEPGGKTTYYPFPGYEEEVNGSTTTRRTTYTVAGQAVAIRVAVVGGSSTLYYLYNDHLGSASVMSNSGGVKIGGSEARYLPFGAYRTTPTTNPAITDRGFTGHKHNDSLGLVYMNARFYVSGIGRFASADTIVPNPTNPQSLNRYSYVRNSPLNMTDPTGHRECELDGNCEPSLPSPQQRAWQRKEESEFLTNIQRPADHQFGAFGGQRTVNCDGNCSQWIHPGRDTNLTDDSNLGDSVYAAYSGRVAKIGYMASTWDENNQRRRSALGEFVVVSHRVGSETFYSVYDHLERGSTTVEEGQLVAQGDVIGGMGNTAAQSTVHLHFEIRRSAAIDLSLDLPFVLPGNPGGNNYFPSNQGILRKYFLDLSSLEW